ASRDDGRPAELVGAGRHIEGMQALEELTVLESSHDDIHRAGRLVDHGRAKDAEGAIAGVRDKWIWRRRDTVGRIREVDLPQRRRVRADISVSVEGVYSGAD